MSRYRTLSLSQCYRKLCHCDKVPAVMKAKEVIFVGYTDDINSYYFRDSSNPRRIQKSRDVTFYEDRFSQLKGNVVENVVEKPEPFILIDDVEKKLEDNVVIFDASSGGSRLLFGRGGRSEQCWPSYVQNNKSADNDWFRLESDKTGTKWFGKCWYVHNLLKYEFDLEFDIPVTYPTTAPELALPSLDGKTAKMYRGGKICLTDHFKPLWARNVPKFGIAHAMALGLGPWLAVEIPDLIEKGAITYQEKSDEAK